MPHSAVKAYLKLDKGTVSRRIKHSIDLGYLVDEQEKRGQPALLKLGDPLPVEVDILPGPELFAQECCSVFRREGVRGAIAIREPASRDGGPNKAMSVVPMSVYKLFGSTKPGKF